jgi:hypothetical protein
MRREHLVRGGLVGGAAGLAALLLLSGCELLVDFDRSKIPQDSGLISFEAASGDATTAQVGDGGADATLSDAPSEATTTSEAAVPDAQGTSTTDSASETSVPSDSSAPDSSKAGDSATESSTAEAGPAEASSAANDASDSSVGDGGGE